jgi:molecular chaperone GrpE (heat shock protein)
MTCYFRHLDEIFKKAGIDVTKENKQELDKMIHKIMGTKYKDCPATWREVKKRIVKDENGFIAQLKTEWKKRT